MMDFKTLLEKINPDIYLRLKTAVETGKWPDGRALSAEQREMSLQAVIAWEIEQGVPEGERTGFVNTQGSSCHTDDTSPLKWQS